MSAWKPIKRRDFIRRLRAIGLHGPYAGSKHEFLVFQARRLAIPSNEEYSVPQLRMMLREVATVVGRSIPLDEWDSL